MNFLDETNEFKLIITNNKKEIINYISSKKKLINYKVMTISEFRKKYYFDYDLKSIYYLMKNHGLKYDIAKMYLNNMIYLTKNEYSHKKLSRLNEYKKELIDKKLLIFDNRFKDYLKNKRIFVIDGFLDKFDKSMFDEVSKYSNLTYHNFLNPIYDNKVIAFDTMDEEVEYVTYKISELFNNGVSLENIKLTNVSKEYENTINRIFSFYNLKTDLDSGTPLYSTYIYKKFIENLNNSYEDALLEIDEYKDTNAYQEIIGLINRLYFVEGIDKEFLNEESKNIVLKNNKYFNVIEVVDYRTHYFKDDEYVFMMGFNNGVIPETIKDEDYITDNIKDELNIDSVLEKNVRSKKVTLDIIKSIKNLTITYKKRSYFESYYPSNLVEDLGEINDNIDISKSYSELASKVRLSNHLDNLIKYGTVNDELVVLNSNFKVPYNTYSHKYSGINKEELNKFLKGKLNLSYSSMDNYNKCSFRFYLSNILKLDIYEQTFQAFIGSLFHDVLQKCLTTDKSVEEEIEEYIKKSERVLDKKEKFYVNKLTKDIKLVVDKVKENLSYTTLDKFMFEKNITIIKERDLTVRFTGFIDKVMYKEEEDRVVVVLIDYKTYKTDITLEYLDEGLYMQLPVYLYLAKDLGINNVVFGGFYLHQILNSSLEKDDSTFKLVGYSNSDKRILNMVDNTYESSSMIKGMKIKNDGDFYSTAKVLSNEEIEDVIDKTDKVIDKVIDNISDAKFDINPKYINKNVGCEFCGFKDICFMDEKDISYIKHEKVSEGKEDA